MGFFSKLFGGGSSDQPPKVSKPKPITLNIKVDRCSPGKAREIEACANFLKYLSNEHNFELKKISDNELVATRKDYEDEKQGIKSNEHLYSLRYQLIVEEGEDARGKTYVDSVYIEVDCVYAHKDWKTKEVRTEDGLTSLKARKDFEKKYMPMLRDIDIAREAGAE